MVMLCKLKMTHYRNNVKISAIQSKQYYIYHYLRLKNGRPIIRQTIQVWFDISYFTSYTWTLST